MAFSGRTRSCGWPPRCPTMTRGTVTGRSKSTGLAVRIAERIRRNGSKPRNKRRGSRVYGAADEMPNHRAVLPRITVNLENDDEDCVPDSGGRPRPGAWHCLGDPGGARVERAGVSAVQLGRLTLQRPQPAGRSPMMLPTIPAALAAPLGICIGVSLGVALGALILATLLGALLAPLDRSAERAPPRSQWPSGPTPAVPSFHWSRLF